MRDFKVELVWLSFVRAIGSLISGSLELEIPIE